MTMVLIFVIFFVVVSAWDVSRVNRLYDKIVSPGARRKSRSEPKPPAPALVCAHDSRERAALSP
jgi:hypothetical protein